MLIWNELDERFKCCTSNQFKKELTLHFISLSLLIFTDILKVYTHVSIYLFCFVPYIYFGTKFMIFMCTIVFVVPLS